MRAMNRSAFALRETSRRLLSLGVVSLALASPWALAREGVDVSKQHSGFARLVPADQVEAAAQQQFAQMASQAKAQNALLPENHPQVVRLKAIAQRIIPYTLEWNSRARQWQWQVMVQLERAQRLLHAGRQDCVLHRHSGKAQADRRRDGNDHGPRDGPRPARARP